MQLKSNIFLRILLNHFHKGSAGDALLRGLSREETQAVVSQHYSQDLAPAFVSPTELIKHIHYSWLIPSIKHAPKSLQPAIASALGDVIKERVCLALEIPSPSHEPAPFVQRFLINWLYAQIQPAHLLPVAYLPPSQLSALAEMDKSSLVVLIDLLSLHDLSVEIRRIVDKKILHSILTTLSPKKREYLKICLSQKETVFPLPFKWDKWEDKSGQWQHLLHRCGIARLAKALCGQHPDLIWHIIHKFDTGRGKLLGQQITEEEIPIVSAKLNYQVVQAIQFLQQRAHHES